MNLSAASAVTLRRAFLELCTATTDGVPGVWTVDSGVPGPTVGITTMTHGNEPCGLAVYTYLRYHFNLKEHLQRGRVIFTINNPDAVVNYFEAADLGDEKKKIRARFVDINMNRLPADLFSDLSDRRVEIVRARMLRKIWAQFDYALDIHSTLRTSLPMIIGLERSSVELFSRFPIETVITGIEKVQQGKPASWFYGVAQAETYAIEAGSHEETATFERAITCAKTFLALLDMMPEENLAPEVDHAVYHVIDSVLFPNDTYELAKPVKSFERLAKGQLIATGDQGLITAKQDCYALMPIPGIKPPIPAPQCGEVMFLAERQQ